MKCWEFFVSSGYIIIFLLEKIFLTTIFPFDRHIVIWGWNFDSGMSIYLFLTYAYKSMGWILCLNLKPFVLSVCWLLADFSFKYNFCPLQAMPVKGFFLQFSKLIFFNPGLALLPSATFSSTVMSFPCFNTVLRKRTNYPFWPKQFIIAVYLHEHLTGLYEENIFQHYLDIVTRKLTFHTREADLADFVTAFECLFSRYDSCPMLNWMIMSI